MAKTLRPTYLPEGRREENSREAFAVENIIQNSILAKDSPWDAVLMGSVASTSMQRYNKYIDLISLHSTPLYVLFPAPYSPFKTLSAGRG